MTTALATIEQPEDQSTREQSIVTLSELARRVQETASARRDFKIDPRAIDYVVPGDAAHPYGFVSFSEEHGAGEIYASTTPRAAKQIASFINVPWQYADRIFKEQPSLAMTTFNTLLHSRTDRRLIRTLINGEQIARAMLSDRYRIRDNDDLALAVIPKLEDPKHGMRVTEASITESRMYIKAVSERIKGEVKKGDIVQMGVVISNSEIGAGNTQVEPYIWRLACLNGMISGTALKRMHVGRGSDDWEDTVREFLKDETLMLEDQVFFAKLGDLVDAALTMPFFERELEKMRVADGEPLGKDPVKITEAVSASYGFSEAEKSAFLSALAADGNLSQWGVVNATTATAKAVATYERSVELERLGGQILETSYADLRQAMKRVN